MHALFPHSFRRPPLADAACRRVVARGWRRSALSAAVTLSLQALSSAQAQGVAPSPSAAASANEASAASPTTAGESSDAGRIEIRGRRVQTQGSLTSISGAEAASVPGAGSDSIKALQALPGVVTPNDGSGEPAIRGSRPSNNAYYVDFVPVSYLFHAGGFISTLPGELVQRFDLYSAAFGPQFANVTGAVLDVNLRQPRSDKLGGQIDASLWAAGVIYEGPIATDQSFFIAARRSYLDFLVGKTEDKDSGVVLKIPNYSDYQIKYLWQPADHQRVNLLINGAKDRVSFNVPAGSTLATQQPAFAGEGRNNESTITQALLWDSDFGEASGNRVAFGIKRERNGTNVGSALNLGVHARTLFLRDELHLQPATGHDLWLGASAEQTRLDLDVDLRNARCTEFEAECDISSADRATLNESLNLRQVAASVRERWQFLPQWALTTGLRWSQDRYLSRRYTEPRLGLEYAVTPTLLLTTAWGRHNEQPDGEQIVNKLGNPRLAHLRARHAMFGVSQSLSDGWSWRAEVYDKKLDNLVVADSVLNYVNGGSGHAWGTELLVRKDSGHGLSGWVSVSWARSLRRNEITGERFTFEYDQPLIVNLVGRWKMNEAWTFGARWSLHSGSLTTPIVGSRVDTDGRVRPVYGALNSERLPTYHRLDLRVDRVFSPTLTAYAEIINAYNRQNVSGYSYNADYTEKKKETQFPFFPSIGVKWVF